MTDFNTKPLEWVIACYIAEHSNPVSQNIYFMADVLKCVSAEVELEEYEEVLDTGKLKEFSDLLNLNIRFIRDRDDIFFFLDKDVNLYRNKPEIMSSYRDLFDCDDDLPF